MTMTINKTLLSRRAVLRGSIAGAGLVTVPLPRLGAMLDGNGTAYAQTGSPLRRFGVYFIGNGFVPMSFAPTPRVTGPIGALGPQLGPLEKVKSKITVVSGFELKTGRPDGLPHGHFFGALSGQHGSGGDRLFLLPTINQVVAQGPMGAGVPYRSIQVAVSAATPGVGQKAYHAVSSRGSNQQNDPSYDPIAQFSKLFRGGASGPTSTVDPVWELERSVLDAVRQDADRLKMRLGREDRERLDSHLTGIRAVEERLQLLVQPQGGAGGACPPGTMAASAADLGPGLNTQVAAAQDDLMVLTLACDRTRVFFYQLTKPAAHVNYGIPEVSGDFHGICHGDAGNDQPKVVKGVAHTIGLFAGLLEKMDAVKEGAATLLDNSSILLSTCVAWGKTHTQWEWPCVIAGRGGLRLGPDGKADPAGRFQLAGGWHYRTDGFENFSQVLLTLANLNGANLDSIGADNGRADTEVSGIGGPRG